MEVLAGPGIPAKAIEGANRSCPQPGMHSFPVA